MRAGRSGSPADATSQATPTRTCRPRREPRMRLGLLTACLPGEPLEDIAAWAGSHGYRALEVAAWPDRPGREWEASHLDVESFGRADAERVRALLAEHDLGLSAVA